MYNLPNKPEQLTFDWLFDRIRQEDVYLRYFGFCDLNSKFCNPLRNDNTPDCCFCWHNGVLFFRDFANKKSYTCVKVVMESENISYGKALHKIYDLFIGDDKAISVNKVYRPKQEKEYKDIKVKIQPFTKLDIEYLKSFGIDSNLCKLYKVYSVKHYWINDELKYTYNEYNPCLGYYFSGKWKLYHYKSKEYRFMTNTSHKDLQGEDQLDWFGDVCIITKSMKDVMVYRKFGINAVAPHSEGLADWKEKIPMLKKRFERVILNFDNDKAGIEATNQVLKEFELESFYIDEHKDISDYYKAKGFKETQKLLEWIQKK